MSSLLGIGLTLAGLTLAHSAFSTWSAYLPWGVGALGVAVLVAILIGGRRRTDERPSVVPPLIGLLLLLSIIPVLQAGAELIVNRASASDLVDRLVGTDVSMVDVGALAIRIPLPAPAEPDGRPSWYYGVRDDPSDPRIALIRSPLTPTALDTRTVVARVTDNPTVERGAATALVAHGWLPAGSNLTSGVRYLAEVAGQESSSELRSVADLGGVQAGSVVRLALHFSGSGVASCEATGRDCAVSSLARGEGGFYQLAQDPATGESILVQTSYPASAAPFRAVGRQVRDQGELSQALGQAWARDLFGWGELLSVAYIDQDPVLPINRVWLVPLGFVALSLLLVVGLRIGYPVFVVEATGRSAVAREVPSWATSGASPIHAAVSGRLARPRGGPLDVHGAPGELRAPPAAGAGPVLLVRDEQELLEVPLPAGGGSLTSLDRGAVHWLAASRPALWIHWFGSDARLVFATQADMARAQALLAPLV